MENLQRVTSPQIDQLTGYLDAAQQAFIKGQYDVSLDAAVFEIADATVTDEDVLTAAFDGFNPIEHRAESSFEMMVARIHEVLTLRREMWAADFCGIPGIVEERLLEKGIGRTCGRVSIATTLESLNSAGMYPL